MNKHFSQLFSATSKSRLKNLFKHTLLAFWLLTLPASGFAPLFYSSQANVVSESTTDSEVSQLSEQTEQTEQTEQPEGADAGAASKQSVQFWLIAGASRAVSLSTAERGKQRHQRLEVAIQATDFATWSRSELRASNRTATLKTSEFTLLGLKPSGVS